MSQIHRDTGAFSREAGRICLVATHAANNPTILRYQHLIAHRGVPAALVPVIAALVWAVGRV